MVLPSAAWTLGTAVAVKAENAAFSSDDVELTAIQFVAETHGVVVKASRELLQDSPNAGEIIYVTLANAMAEKLDDIITDKMVEMADNTVAVDGAISWEKLAAAVLREDRLGLVRRKSAI